MALLPPAGGDAADAKPDRVSVRPQQRDALKNARNAYAATSKTLETLKVKQIEGPPKCYTMGCKTRFESGIFVDDELKQKKMVKQRYPDNYFII